MNFAFRVVAGVLAAAGLLSLVYCLWLAMHGDVADSNFAQCEAGLFPDDPPEGSESDQRGELRVIGVWPAETEIGNHLCVAIAGVVTLSEETRNRTTADDARTALAELRTEIGAATPSAADRTRLNQGISEVAAAEAKEFRPLPPTELTVFMNDEKAPFTVNVDSLARPQIIRFRLPASDDANQTGAKFWRDLLRGTTVDTEVRGELPVRLGISRVADTTTVPDAVAGDPFTLRVFGREAFGWGLVSLGLLVLGFLFFASATTLLRDNKLSAKEIRAQLNQTMTDAGTIMADPNATAEQKAKAEGDVRRAKRYLGFLGTRDDDNPAGCFSLGRSQMAVWFFMVIVAYVFISMTLGQYLNLISPEVLVLLGISGTTGLAAILVSGGKADDRPTKNFVYDILCDADGPQLQRIQTVAWTIVLGGIFAWIAVQEFRLMNFDTNLLLLMGIANSLYLGFKMQEG